MTSPKQVPEQSALLNEMHRATRSEHAFLNRTIVTRLPLCMPPYVSDPYFYTAGMTVFAQIYFAIESTWDDLLQEQGSKVLSARDHDILSTLKTQYLARTQRLDNDLRNLRTSVDVLLLPKLDELHAEASHFRHGISKSISEKPHLFLAYAWPMYLALFNGGRWIANQLLVAGPDFWPADGDDIAQDFLSFWYFDDSVHDENHGDNVKVDFKRKLNVVSEQLSQPERDEVILEVKRVFAICSEMIALLDEHALSFGQEQQGLRCKTINAQGTVDWLSSMAAVKSAWQSFRAVVGFAATPPSALRKDFEQHA